MGPQELMQVLVAARKAREDGVPIADINAAIKARTGADDMASLAQMWAQAANAPDEDLAAYAEQGGAVKEFARGAAHGATFGFSDELAGIGAALIPGGQGYTEARDEARERMERQRRLDPGASLAAEVAGGVAMPVLGTGGLFRGASPVARAAGRGAVGGAGYGALYGAGEAETMGDIPREAATDALIGGVAGGLLGPAGVLVGKGVQRAAGATRRGAGAMRRGLFGSGAGRGERIARGMQEAGELAPSVKALDESVEAGKRRVSATHFQPIERRLTEGLADEGLTAILKSEDIVKHANRVMKGNVDRPVTFREIQSIRNRLHREIQSAFRTDDLNRAYDARAALQELDEAVTRLIPDYGDARAAWARVVEPENAFYEGRAMMRGKLTNSAEEIAAAMNQYSPEGQQAFRSGMAKHLTTQLEQRATPTSGAITNIFEAGPEMQAKLRLILPEPAQYDEFMRLVTVERNWQKARKLIQRSVPWLLLPLAGGAGVGIGRSMFD